MEHPDYLSAKRYSDLMKTMWFTFLYGSAIPIGVICSCTGVIFYYFIDKYNILRRRTVKESISKELSVEMINLLDLIIFFSAFGEITMSYAFYKEVSIYDMCLISISIVFVLLPMESINIYLFPLENVEEVTHRDAHIPKADPLRRGLA